MKKLLIFLFIGFFLTLNKVHAGNELINSLKKGGKIVFIRHAYAPGNGDPENFDLKKCLSQRNLNSKGKEQAKKIGLFFNKNKIPVDKILSSEWCRCKDTARLAFQKYKIFSPLNSFYDIKFKKNKKKQIIDLKDYLNKWDSKKNLILITHYVVISEILNITSSSGEIIVVDKKLNIIGSRIINN